MVNSTFEDYWDYIEDTVIFPLYTLYQNKEGKVLLSETDLQAFCEAAWNAGYEAERKRQKLDDI